MKRFFKSQRFCFFSAENCTTAQQILPGSSPGIYQTLFYAAIALLACGSYICMYSQSRPCPVTLPVFLQIHAAKFLASRNRKHRSKACRQALSVVYPKQPFSVGKKVSEMLSFFQELIVPFHTQRDGNPISKLDHKNSLCWEALLSKLKNILETSTDSSTFRNLTVFP